MTTKGPSLPPSITKFALFLVAGMVLAFFAYWLSKWRPATFTGADEQQSQALREAILSGIPQLIERWQEGDVEGKFGSQSWKCAELPKSEQLAPEFLRCRPSYLECWARGDAGVSQFLSVKLGDTPVRLSLAKKFDGRHVKWVTRQDFGDPELPLEGALVVVRAEGLGEWPMILENTCRDSFLPERIYGYGPRAGAGARPEFLWDNVGRKLYLDRHLVTRDDVALWKQEEADPASRHLPETELSAEERVAYCAHRGARLLEAKLFDAATMTPADLQRPFPTFIVRPWLPWSRDRRGSFFEEAARDRDWRPSAEDCARAYVKDCQGAFPYRPQDSNNVSWAGVFHVLGGVSESFRNPIDPTLTTRASRVAYFAHDERHQLGAREEVRESDRLGFRCYREVFP